MNWLIKNWRNYVWVPSGEIVRGVEVTALGAAIQVVLSTDPGKLADPDVWGVAALVGGALAGLEYLKGKLPAAP